MKRPIDAGLPRTLTVLGQRYEVKTTKNLHVGTEEVSEHDVNEEWVHEGVMHVLGVCDRDALIIELDLDSGYDRFRETLTHEVLHAIVAKAGLNHDLLSGNHEEQVVNRIAPILLQFLRDNPRFIEFITNRRVGGAESAR